MCEDGQTILNSQKSLTTREKAVVVADGNPVAELTVKTW